ncbi:MAG: hypothetical protein NT027_01455 [Proteobacteria bacterium]|nr:hypothetical protein [Pseudomonadota bacterium]
MRTNLTNMMTIVALAITLNGCQSSSGFKFSKSRILDATMDPSKSSPASQSLAGSPNGLWEKAQTGSSSGVGSSCPTCG